jgi:hypothetical protein
MAYRFLLEVPQTISDAASVAVEQIDDAQVVLVRPSHGLGVDDPYVDLTVAAHSLVVIDAIFDWLETIPGPTAEVRLVLHGGERLPLAGLGRQRTVAMIRMDQPWVERSIPKVGEHEPTIEPAGYTVGAGAPTALMQEAFSSAAPAMLLETGAQAAETFAAADAAPRVHIRAINYVLIQVNDLPRAETFYQEFLNMTLLGRVRRGADGTMLQLPQSYTWEMAMQTGELADITFLSNGALTVAAQRMGLGVRLSHGAVDLVSLGVDARTFATLKGEALMRPLTILRSGVASFVFRDPFDVDWEVAVIGSVPLIPV